MRYRVANGGQVGIGEIAGTGGVVDVAMTANRREIDEIPRIREAEWIETSQGKSQNRNQSTHGRRGGILYQMVADQANPDRSDVVRHRVIADDPLTADTTLVDVAVLVDQVVVANVAPGPRDGMVVVDGTHLRGWVG